MPEGGWASSPRVSAEAFFEALRGGMSVAIQNLWNSETKLKIQRDEIIITGSFGIFVFVLG